MFDTELDLSDVKLRWAALQIAAEAAPSSTEDLIKRAELPRS